ncbi:prepilin peptidase [Candidatus Woesearchaeota archaeon]|nr:prepilin peptidase [Candidatus Woesearchaeota archaeon]
MLQYPLLVQLVALAFLSAAAINDVKKREVPNWVNYGLVIAGLGLGLLHSIVAFDWHFLVFSIAGALAALALSALMFYTGQWGGGDSKLLIGLGSLLGLPFGTRPPFLGVESQFVSFLFNLVAISVAYAIVIGTVLAIKSKKKFAAAVRKQLESYSLLRKLLLIVSAVGLVIIIAVNDVAIRFAFAALLVTLFFGLYLSIMAKAVEKACMLRLVSPLRLTEGDWIAKDVVVGGKRICGPKDLGIEKRQIRRLTELYRKGKIRAVLIKEGIPFSPSFLLAYIVTIFFGNLFFAFVR